LENSTDVDALIAEVVEHSEVISENSVSLDNILDMFGKGSGMEN
jgi:hypothetical protein